LAGRRGTGLSESNALENHTDCRTEEQGVRTCLGCRRLHSLASPCPRRTDRSVTALRQWESGYMLDDALSPQLKAKAGEIAAHCVWFLPDPP